MTRPAPVVGVFILATLLLATTATADTSEPTLEEALSGDTTLTIDELGDTNPQSPDEYLSLARVVEVPERSIDFYQQAIKRSEDPEQILEATRELLDLLLLVDQVQGLDTSVFEQVVDQQSDRLLGRDWLKLGWIWRGQDNIDRARNAFEQARAVYETSSRATLALASLALEQERLEESDELLEAYVRDEPSNPPYWYLKGRLHELRGQEKEARRAYRQAIEQNQAKLTKPLLSQRLDRLTAADDSNGDTTSEENETGSLEPTVHRIQVGSFGSRDSARSLKERVSNNYEWPVVIEQATLDGTKYYRVQVTGFRSREEAEDFMSEYEGNGFYLTVERS